MQTILFSIIKGKNYIGINLKNKIRFVCGILMLIYKKLMIKKKINLENLRIVGIKLENKFAANL